MKNFRSEKMRKIKSKINGWYKKKNDKVLVKQTEEEEENKKKNDNYDSDQWKIIKDRREHIHKKIRQDTCPYDWWWSLAPHTHSSKSKIGIIPFIFNRIFIGIFEWMTMSCKQTTTKKLITKKVLCWATKW